MFVFCFVFFFSSEILFTIPMPLPMKDRKDKSTSYTVSCYFSNKLSEHMCIKYLTGNSYSINYKGRLVLQRKVDHPINLPHLTTHFSADESKLMH